MATTDAVEELPSREEELRSLLTLMQNSNKAKRRKALDRFSELVFNEAEDENLIKLNEIAAFSFSILVSRMSDSSEMNRIKSSTIVHHFIEKFTIQQNQLIDIIPLLHHRLASNPVIEDSEDVRLIYVNIMIALIIAFEEKLVPYMNDFVNILKERVIDVSPDVRKASCDCIYRYARATKEKFHMQSSSLVKPLIQCMGYNRFKIRIAAINGIGSILLYGDGKNIQDVSGPLAQCALDIPQVRLTLVSLGGALALHMPDRYSYWHRILPLLLFGLKDDDKDVKDSAINLWDDVGMKYEKENEEQLKDDLNFDTTPKHYPKGEVPTRVGCRALVQKSLYHILPGLLADMDDWLEGPRLQAAKLLATLILNAQTGVTQYAEKILEGLLLAAGDKESAVANQAVECCEYLGHFLPASTYLPLMLPRLSAQQHGEKPLLVLSALARGSPTSELQNNLSAIIEAISCDDVVYKCHTDHQIALLSLIALIIEKCDPAEDYELFRALVFVASSSACPDTVNVALQQLQALSDKIGMKNVSELYRKHLHTILQALEPTSNGWKEHDPQFLLFIGLMEHAGEALGNEVELLVNILCGCVPKKQDPFVSLRCFSKFRALLLREDHPLEASGQLGKYLPKLITECIAVFLPWHAGGTASALRTASLAALVALCQITVADSQMVEALRSCLSIVPALIEDDAEDTRHLSCDLIYWIVTNYHQLITSDTLHILADKLVKRFDDKSATVRLRAAKVIAVLYKNLPSDYDPCLQSARLQDLYKGAVLFLDDPDIKLQGAVADALEVMGKALPETLTDILEKDFHKYRNQHHCQKLIDAMKALEV